MRKKEPRVICQICWKEYDHPYAKPDSNNTYMHKHIKKHKMEQEKEMQRQEKSKNLDKFFPKFNAADIGVTKFELEELLLNTAVTCNWPFEQFNNPQFQAFVLRGFPGHSCPSRKVMSKLLKTKAEACRVNIKERLSEIDSRISLALDCWTSPNRWEFMGTFPFKSTLK